MATEHHEYWIKFKKTIRYNISGKYHNFNKWMAHYLHLDGNFFKENEPYIQKVPGYGPGNVLNYAPQASTNAKTYLQLIFLA